MKYRVAVTHELLVQMLEPGREIKARCSLGLPDGVTPVDAYCTDDSVVVVFEGPGDEDEIDLTPIFEAL